MSSNNNNLLVLSISTIVIFCIFLTPNLIIFSHAKPIVPVNVCDKAHDPQACLIHISEALADNKEHDGLSLLRSFLIKSLPKIRTTMEAVGNTSHIVHINNHKDATIADCMHLMDMSIDRAKSTLAALANWGPQSEADNAHTWLSGILTNHFTCLDGLANNTIQQSSMKEMVQDLIARTRTSLALLVSLLAPDHKDVLQPLSGEFPSWISGRDRRLLETSPKNMKLDAIVGREGCGDYNTIQAAVDSAPDNSKSRYVIYVKKGIYKEHVVVGKKKKNIVIIGEGMHSTIITGHLNEVDGTSTFDCATLIAEGDGFMLQDVWVQNTAGPEKHQAVALRVSADKSVIYRCQIDAYEDTLYTHRDRQFYRDCLIKGTVDFIFGDGAVVIQNCVIVAKRPMDNQQNMITAQGRVDPYQNSGISIQLCDIIPSSDLEPIEYVIPSYLGRPWKEYSRTVVMQSYIDGHIHPDGWAKWNHEDFALTTLYYGEYANTGPGAGTSNRVDWPGYHVITDAYTAQKFTVTDLIQGDAWLSSTGVPYNEGL
ncbi:Plant invertase/pectin methylesterase inhibitor superfamily [Euphorbia peplus]|nr:Plant invertase/pectin methylesterase inhibitor superfamily [Euphorbia peplus]